MQTENVQIEKECFVEDMKKIQRYIFAVEHNEIFCFLLTGWFLYVKLSNRCVMEMWQFVVCIWSISDWLISSLSRQWCDWQEHGRKEEHVSKILLFEQPSCFLPNHFQCYYWFALSLYIFLSHDFIFIQNLKTLPDSLNHSLCSAVIDRNRYCCNATLYTQ